MPLTDLQTTAAHQSLAAAYDGTQSFPQIIAALIAAGFESYTVDYRRATTTYFLPAGEALELPNPATPGHVAPTFDATALQANIRKAQTNAPGYTYTGFCAAAKAAGCAGYMVSFSGKRALYFGRTAETHTEYFPS